MELLHFSVTHPFSPRNQGEYYSLHRVVVRFELIWAQCFQQSGIWYVQQMLAITIVIMMTYPSTSSFSTHEGKDRERPLLQDAGCTFESLVDTGLFTSLQAENCAEYSCTSTFSSTLLNSDFCPRRLNSKDPLALILPVFWFDSVKGGTGRQSESRRHRLQSLSLWTSFLLGCSLAEVVYLL
jgi:hypothetical protein